MSKETFFNGLTEFALVWLALEYFNAQHPCRTFHVMAWLAYCALGLWILLGLLNAIDWLVWRFFR